MTSIANNSDYLNSVDASSLIVLTDLDGTLLDHHSYSYEPALDAIARLKSRNIPLILISSKTRVEIQSLQHELGISDPFVCENGAAIYWHGDNAALPNSLNRKVFSVHRDTIIARLEKIRQQQGFEFVGFGDLSVPDLAQLTGLSPEQALLASRREYTEPLQWQDSEENLQKFTATLAENDLRVVKGGRFYSVMSEFDKSTALEWLRQFYNAQANSVQTTVIALGDSKNDEQMLDGADIAVLIQSSQSASLNVHKPRVILRTDEAGPKGWSLAINKLLDQILSK